MLFEVRESPGEKIFLFCFSHRAARGVLSQDLEVTHHVRWVNRWPGRLHAGVSEQQAGQKLKEMQSNAKHKQTDCFSK